MRDLRYSDGKWGARSGLSIKSSLAHYQIILAAIAVLSGLFYAWSKLNGGLTMEGGCLQVVFVYGPTAVSFLVACFWGHVESEIRCSTPGLDGASSIFGSLRQARHRRVLLAVGCSVLVKLLVIISTGLVNSNSEGRLMVKGIPTLIMGLMSGLLVGMIGWLRYNDSEEQSTLGTISDQSYLGPERSNEDHLHNAAIGKSSLHECERALTRGRPRWEDPKPRLWHQMVMSMTPVVLIILLEYSYQYSRHHNGFKDVNPYDGFTAFIWRSIPPLLVLGVSTCYDLWAFRSKNRQQISHLDWDPETSTLHSSSLLHSSYISTATTIISIITGNLILVVASGLFVTQNTDSDLTISVTQQGTFDFSGVNLSNIGLDAALVNLKSSNILWTHGDMTFPSFYLPRDINTEENSLITVTLPASRAKSNCAALSPENIELSHLSNKNGSYLNITAPPSCASTSFSLEAPYGYFGLAQTIGDNLCNTTHPECGRWLVSTGYIAAEDTSRSKATVMLCNPSVETVQVEVTFHTSSLQIDISNPPIVHEDTATHTAFFLDYLEDNSEGYLQDDIHRIMKPERHVSPDYYADELFQVMVSETPPVDYVGEENVHRLLAAVQTGFGIRQAQHTNNHLRKNLPEGKRPELDATMWNPSRLRIVQDAGATYACRAFLHGYLFLQLEISLLKGLTRRLRRHAMRKRERNFPMRFMDMKMRSSGSMRAASPRK